MHLTQAGLAEFVDRVPSGGHFSRTLHADNQALDLQLRIVLRVTGNEIPDGMQIATRLR